MLEFAQGPATARRQAVPATSEANVGIDGLLTEVAKVQEMLRRLLFEAGELIAKTQRLSKELDKKHRNAASKKQSQKSY